MMSQMNQGIEHRTPVGKIAEYKLLPGKTIWEMVDIYDIKVNQIPTVCLKNGEPTLRKDWAEPLGDSDVVVFVAVPQGSFFTDILKVVAMVALAIVAPWAAGIIGTAIGVTSAIGLSLIQAGIMIAGSFLIQALFPPEAPNTEEDNASPTYSLNAQGNAARLYQPKPRLYGNHMIFPDFAGQAYSVFEQNTQYLYMTFCLGLGKYQVEKIRVEDTVLWDDENGYNEDFIGITFEICDPGQKVTLFHTQVINSQEVSDLAMNNWSDGAEYDYFADGTISSRSGRFSVISPGMKVTIEGAGAPSNNGVFTVIEVGTASEYIKLNTTLVPNSNDESVIGIAEESQWVGPYVANPADTITNRIQVDFIASQGIFRHREGDILSNSANVEVQARLIDTAGLPIGDWFILGQHVYTRATRTAQRITEEYYVSDGRYEVRTRRTNVESTNQNYVSNIAWVGMKSFIPDDNVFDDVTILAVKMQATGQLAQNATTKINVIQTAIIPTYNVATEEWTDLATRSIAWAAYDAASNTDYGGRREVSTIDLDKFVFLNDLWESRGDYFDGIFDSQTSVWDALSQILRAGRAHPIMISGILSIKRRGLDEIPRGVFTPENIVRGSFETEHTMFTEESADDVIVEFMDRRTWKLNEVVCSLPGSTHQKPERVRLIGITDRLQAWREGIFMAAYSERNRIAVSFRTELAGRLLSRGDYILAAHDLYEWGQNGTVEAYFPDTRIVTTNREVILDGEEYIMLRKRNGTGYGPIKCTQGEYSDEVILDEADLELVEASQGLIAEVWAYDDDQLATNFIICKQTTDYKRLTLVSGRPNDDVYVDLVCIIDDPSVHTADIDNEPPDEIYPFGVVNADGRARISTFTVVKTPESSGTEPLVDFDWSVSDPVADTYILEISYDGSNWNRIYESDVSNFLHGYSVINGILHARVAGIIDGTVGEFRNFVGLIGDANTDPLPVASIDIEYGTYDTPNLSVSWSPGVRATSYDIEIWSESTPGSTVFDVLELSATTSSTFQSWLDSAIIAAGGPWGSIEVRVFSIADTITSDAATETATMVLATPTGLDLVNPYGDGSEIYPRWDAVPGATRYAVDIYTGGLLPVFSAYTANLNRLITSSEVTAAGGPWTDVEIRVTAQRLEGGVVVMESAEASLLAP